MSASLSPINCAAILNELVERFPSFTPASEAWRLRPEEPWTTPTVQEPGILSPVPSPVLLRFPVAPGLMRRGSLIVFPGGGYRLLAADHEGSVIANWANGIGFDAYVALSRCPGVYPEQLVDAQRAFQLVRSWVHEQGDANAAGIGVCGFSAGGHLAGLVALTTQRVEAGSASNVDFERPAFALLVYPVVALDAPHGHLESGTNLLGPKTDNVSRRARSLDALVVSSRELPPLFLVHGLNDTAVLPENSLLLWRAYRSVGGPVELQLYENGPHGIGMRPGYGSISQWPQRAEEWLARVLPSMSR